MPTIKCEIYRDRDNMQAYHQERVEIDGYDGSPNCRAFGVKSPMQCEHKPDCLRRGKRNIGRATGQHIRSTK